MRYGVLGPVEATRDDVVAVRGPQQRRLLALMLSRPGQSVSTKHLIECLWLDGLAPAGAGRSVMTYVSRLRAALGRGSISTVQEGYRLELDGSVFDAQQFESLMAEAGTAEHLRALGIYDQALALWRGSAYGEFGGEWWLLAEARRLNDLRVVAMEERAEVLLALAHHHRVIPELNRLMADQPLRERPVSLVMQALFATGRQADALREFQSFRVRLGEETGLEPSDELTALERSLAAGHWNPQPGSVWPSLIVAPTHENGSSSGVASSAHTLPVPRRGQAGVPAARTSFVGRDDELDELLKVINTSQLVTITGVGGSGKTRLAYEAARRLEPESVVVVSLAGLREGTQVPAEVAAALGVTHPGAIPEVIAGRELLVVLDNCEHLVDAVSRFVSWLVDSCVGVRVLATSRESLAVAGETIWPVPLLNLDEAVALFRIRAAAPADEALVRAACERLGRLPLAIELAAARLRSMPLVDLVARLDGQLRLLTTGARDVPRQQTLRATLDWSHALLTSEERTVFPRLGVFAGGFSLAAAEKVVGSKASVVNALDGLVVKSLLELSGENDRYHMLEPVRQYALEHLIASGEQGTVHEDHARWAVDLTREANRNMFVDQRRWSALLDAERDNLGAAIGWAVDHDRVAVAVRIVSNLAFYWFASARTEALVWIPLILEHLDDVDRDDRGRALLAAGITHGGPVDRRPIDWLCEAECIFRELGNQRALGTTMFFLGRAAASWGELEIADRAFAESLVIHERLGDLFGWGWSLSWTGILARLRGDLETDELAQRQVLALCSSIPHVVAQAWSELADVAAERGDLAMAAENVSRAAELYRDVGDCWQLAAKIGQRALYLIDKTSVASAADAIESISIIRDLGANPSIDVLEVAGSLLVRAGMFQEATTILGAVHDKMIRRPDAGSLPHPMRTLLNAHQSIVDDPQWANEVTRGRQLGTRDAATNAIEWLRRAYPAEGTAKPRPEMI